MEMSDKQRRWWFANHPEYSRSRTGATRSGQSQDDMGSAKIRPEDVDEYARNALKYLNGNEAALVKIIQKHFGTQAQTEETTESDRAALLDDEEFYENYQSSIDEFFGAALQSPEQPLYARPREEKRLTPRETRTLDNLADSYMRYQLPKRFGAVPAYAQTTHPPDQGHSLLDELYRRARSLSESAQQSLQSILQQIRERMIDLDQARKPFFSDTQIPLPSPVKLPAKPCIGDAVDRIFDFTDRFRNLEDSEEGPQSEDFKKKIKQGVRILDETLDLKQAIDDRHKKKTPKENDSESNIPRIGGRRPINYRYAGKAHPSGVKYDEQGFPDFTPYAIDSVEVEGLTGDRRHDARLANNATGRARTPIGYKWHHHQDGQTMQLVPENLHDEALHTGGVARIKEQKKRKK